MVCIIWLFLFTRVFALVFVAVRCFWWSLGKLLRCVERLYLFGFIYGGFKKANPQQYTKKWLKTTRFLLKTTTQGFRPQKRSTAPAPGLGPPPGGLVASVSWPRTPRNSTSSPRSLHSSPALAVQGGEEESGGRTKTTPTKRNKTSKIETNQLIRKKHKKKLQNSQFTELLHSHFPNHPTPTAAYQRVPKKKPGLVCTPRFAASPHPRLYKVAPPGDRSEAPELSSSGRLRYVRRPPAKPIDSLSGQKKQKNYLELWKKSKVSLIYSKHVKKC